MFCNQARWAELDWAWLIDLNGAQLGATGLSWDELVLRSSERLRCAQEEKVVASKVFCKKNKHFQAVLRFSSFFKEAGELG